MHKWLSHVNTIIFRDYSFLAESKWTLLCYKLCNHVKCFRAKISSSMSSIAAITNRPPTHIGRVRIFQTTESPREKCGLTSISQKWNVKLAEVQQVKQSSRHRRPGNRARASVPSASPLWMGTRRVGGGRTGTWAGAPARLCQPLLQMAVFTGDFGIRRNHYHCLLQFLLQNRLESI